MADGPGSADAKGNAFSEPEKKKSPWLDAWYDPVAGMSCYSSFLCLADLAADGDHRLVMVDMKKRIRMYKGTTIQWEHKLPDVPCAVQSFYHEAGHPPIPTLAVASGHRVLIFRNMRPSMQYRLPPLEIDPIEKDIWKDLTQDGADIQAGFDKLNAARENGTALSNQSIDFLAVEDLESQMEYVRGCKPNEEYLMQQQTAITCMEVLKQNMDEPTAVSMLVIGTENRMIYILNSSALEIAAKVKLEAVPTFISVLGLFDVEYRITVACRDGNIYTVKNGQVLSNVIELETQPVGLVRFDKNVYVGCMDNVIHCFHFKGKKNHSIYLPCPISCMSLLQITKSRVAKALVVALQNGEVRLYNGKHLIATVETNDVVAGVKLGTFGREEGSMVLSFKSGALMVKILQRNANLDGTSVAVGPPPEQDIPLDVPKKTKLYVEQTSREREQAIDMHRTFQRDLCKLRLSTARAYVNLLGTGHGPMSTAAGAQVRINAQVLGMGPQFKILARIQNAGATALYDVPVHCTTNQNLYRIPRPSFFLPVLVPQQVYLVEVPVTCINENGGTAAVRIFLANSRGTMPLISAIVQMPISEPAVIDSF
ncbi:Bbs1 [Symbiodinium pilosum]|uniref:Bbs1 protein n=1 Tax=Symbiodinium pilosum TaxID=2952 RepID=A0A812UXY8_SYMPI|nr:Bbs1 [Symbiodinium pilosum]